MSIMSSHGTMFGPWLVRLKFDTPNRVICPRVVFPCTRDQIIDRAVPDLLSRLLFAEDIGGIVHISAIEMKWF